MQDISGIFVADGYEVWADGVFKRNGEPTPDGMPRPTASLDARVPWSYSQACLEPVTPTPMWVKALGTAPDLPPDRQFLALIAYRNLDDGIERERWVGVADIIDRRRVMVLGAEGLPVTGENAGAVVDYLAGCRFANQGKLPAHTVVSRSGLHEVPGGIGFLLGDRWITADGGPAAIPDPRRKDPFSGAFAPKGDYEAWKAKWLELRDSGGPLFRWQMGAAFAAPLLKLMGQRTFLVHDFDKTGRGKCVVAGTLISTASGLRRIEDLDREEFRQGFNEIHGHVYKVWNGEKFVTPTHFLKEVGRVLRVRTSRGYEITGTPEHPMMTQRGWVRLDELRSDDALKVSRPMLSQLTKLVEFDPVDYPGIQTRRSKTGTTYQDDQKIPKFKIGRDEARLMGYLVADGWIASENGTMSMTSDIEILGDAQSILKNSFGVEAKVEMRDGEAPQLRWCSVQLQRALGALGLHSALAGEKSVPEAILRSPPQIVREFLRGYIDCECSISTASGVNMEITTASEQLSREIQVLLLAFGIPTSRRVKEVLYEGERRSYWRTTLTCADAVLRFASEIGVFTSARAQQLGLALVKALSCTGWTKHSTEPDFFDVVDTIEPLDGEELVYDLTIPDGHAFSANGLISHNSAKAKFLLSIYGNPKALMRTMNQTENAMVETFRYFTDLPVLMDELQVHKGERPFLIYALAGEKGKARSTKTGGLQDEITHFRSVVFTTGEEPLIGSNDLGGQTNRVIEMRSGVQIPEARKLHDFAEANYGWAGEEWLKRVVLPTFSDPDAQRLVQVRFESMMAQLQVAQLQAGSDSQRVAAITAGAQAQFYAETYLLGIDSDEALVQALADARVVIGRLPNTDTPLWLRAVDAIRDDMASNPTAYLDTRDQSGANRIGRDIRGVKMTDGVALIPSIAAKFLAGEPHKFPVRQVFSDLAEMGFLSWDEGTKFHQQVRRVFPDGAWRKCYVVRWVAFEPRPLETLAQMLAEEKAAAEGGQGAPEPESEGAKVLSIDELIRQRRTGSQDGEG